MQKIFFLKRYNQVKWILLTQASSMRTRRCFCPNCACLIATLNEGYPNICITIASLNNPNLIVPNEQHSYKESAPIWWAPQIVK